jgi:hypothetical protein
MSSSPESRSDALKAIRSTREMLKGREDESFHIPPATALFLVYECLDTVEAALSERAKPDDDTLAARLVEIADSNSDLYENERLWLREAAAVLESYRQGKAE